MRSPDRPARSESLYPLSYPGPWQWPGTQRKGEWVDPNGIRSPDRPARNQSLYSLRYPGTHTQHSHVIITNALFTVTAAWNAMDWTVSIAGQTRDIYSRHLTSQRSMSIGSFACRPMCHANFKPFILFLEDSRKFPTEVKLSLTLGTCVERNIKKQPDPYCRP